MKKWIRGIALILILAVGGIYFFIPGSMEITDVVYIKSTPGIAQRFLLDETRWYQWWPGAGDSSQNEFSYRDYNYRITKKMFSTADVQIEKDDFLVSSHFTMIPTSKDSILIKWGCAYNNSYNPVTRIQRYQQAGHIKQNMGDILDSLQQFLENDEKIYGLSIEKTKVTDTLLIVTSQTFTAWPSTEQVYSLIDKLKNNLQQQGATATGYPMLNMLPMEADRFETMVAVPINKEITTAKDISIRRMVPGNILVTEIKGGVHNIYQAFSQMEIYLTDYHYESPAKPFQSLVTDRRSEPDSSKWITRIYYPVF